MEGYGEVVSRIRSRLKNLIGNTYLSVCGGGVYKERGDGVL